MSKKRNKHPGIKNIGPNQWQVRYFWRCPRTGQDKEIKRVCNGSEDDAIELQRQLADEAHANDSGIRRRPTLGEYSRSWLEARMGSLARPTAAKYAGDLARHILPALGNVYVDALRPSDVQGFVTAQTSSGAAGNSVLNRLRLLRTIAKDALADGLTERDFCARVRPPKVRRYTEDDPNALTAEQLDAVTRAIPDYWYALFAVLAFTGLRWGEVTALQWPDLDYDRGEIGVRRRNWKGEIGEVKTEASRRSAPMSPELADILRAHRARMVRAQHPGLEGGWVFPTAAGELHRGTPLNPVLKAAIRKAGIPFNLTPHGLRRTFNDLLRRVATGQVVRAIVGHATEAMTEHYSVVRRDEKQAAQAQVIQMAPGVLRVVVKGGQE